MRSAFLICGLVYGDEGKGACVDHICRTRDVGLVVRYNGGSQAAHNVIDPDGRHHTFAQFGSGTFVPGVRTHLSRFMLIDPSTMMCEEEHLQELGIADAWERTTVDAGCLIITPFQKAVNRIQQMCSAMKTSCGMGIGQTRSDYENYKDKVLFAGDLSCPKKAKEKLAFIQKISRTAVEQYGIFARKRCEEHFNLLFDPYFIDSYWRRLCEWPRQITASDAPWTSFTEGNIVFEGAQGVLLDEVHGDYGFNTWTNTTFGNALQLLKEAEWAGETKKIGVIRTYFTRHGAGPFKTESPKLDNYPEPHNEDDDFQGKFRRGVFDMTLIKRSIKICGGVDGIAVNHLDVNPKFFTRERKEIERLVMIRGFGPTANDREWAA